MSGSNSRMRSDSFAGSHRYWNTTAYSQPAAQALAERLSLSLVRPESGSSPGMQGGLIYPIRRLVVTGEDTSVNMEILLGPEWEGCRKVWEECRMTVLAAASSSSPTSPSPSPTSQTTKMAMAAALDECVPRWTPRPASTKEEARLERMRRNQREKERTG